MMLQSDLIYSYPYLSSWIHLQYIQHHKSSYTIPWYWCMMHILDICPIFLYIHQYLKISNENYVIHFYEYLRSKQKRLLQISTKMNDEFVHQRCNLTSAVESISFIARITTTIVWSFCVPANCVIMTLVCFYFALVDILEMNRMQQISI